MPEKMPASLEAGSGNSSDCRRLGRLSTVDVVGRALNSSGQALSRPLVCLIENVVGHILNVVGAQALTEGWHGALAIGHLILDGLHIVAACQILFDRLLSDFL